MLLFQPCFGCLSIPSIYNKRLFSNLYAGFTFPVPGNEENGMEAQDTPVISVESNRNNNETETMVQEPVKPKKTAKLPKSSNKAVDSAAINIVTTAPTTGGDGPTTDASASASGIKCN